MRRSLFTIGLVIAFALQGCSSSYKPAQSPRIAVVMDGGSYTLVRNGTEYAVGVFGAGLVDAVEGNRAAEEHAHAYQNLTIAGLSTYAFGLSAMIGGLVLVGSSNAGSENTTERTVGTALALGGIGAFLVSLPLIMSAQPHLWDAVNTYNDSVDVWRMPPPMPMLPPPPPAPPRAPAPVPVPAPASAPVPAPAPASVPASP